MTQFNPTSPLAHDDRPKPPSFYKAASGLKNWLYTLDHKRIGLMYLGFVLTAFLLGGIFALLVRTELLTPNETIV
ncbi:MAG TPA: cytochrome c oxidase subunit I, partial [Pseudomonadota bacterium]|nr:cytochrome c oxidase subunit I [Pseudomonadota bacterium]